MKPIFFGNKAVYPILFPTQFGNMTSINYSKHLTIYF